MPKSIFDPLGLSQANGGSPGAPLLDVLGIAQGRGAVAGSTVNDYLRQWLESLLPHARGGGNRGLEELLPDLGQRLAGAVGSDVRKSGRSAAVDPPVAANLEHLVRELASGDLQQVADLIKRVHAGRAASPLDSESSRATAAGTSASAGSPDGASQESRPAASDRGDASSYDQARRHLLEHEEEDRRRAWLTDRILDQLRTPPVAASPAPTRPAPSSPLQSEVRLSCPVNGRAAGRFRIANATGFDLDVELRASAVRGTPVGWERRLPIRFDDAVGKLGAGQERLVKVAIDTAGCPLSPGAELELAVDVLGGGRLLHKVWVSIQVTSEV